MKDMLAKSQSEKEAEQTQYATYQEFCEQTIRKKGEDIQEQERKLNTLKADLQLVITEVKDLSRDIAQSETDIEAWKGDKKAATIVRDMEKMDYESTHTDYSESLDALKRAISVLKTQAFDRPQLFFQLSELEGMGLATKQAQKVMNAFFDTYGAPDELEVEAPEAKGYGFQSSFVIDMLAKLNDKFRDELSVLELEEKKARYEYKLLMDSLSSQLEEAEQDNSEKAQLKSKKLQQKADAQGDIDDISKTKLVDEQYVSDLEATCAQKANEYGARQQLRMEEIKAIEQAIDIISSQAVSGSSKEYLHQMLQTSVTSFTQLRLDRFNSKESSQSRDHVVTFLRIRAKQLGSQLLDLAAQRAAADPMNKVVQMVKDLIVQLNEQANEEAQRKAFCDKELGVNKKTRSEKTRTVEMLHAEIEEKEALVAKLTSELSDLQNMLAELDESLSEAVKLRQKEKAKNTQTIEDAKAGQEAVIQALAVLKEFYAKAALSTAMMQQSPAEAPEIFDKAYKGQNSNGVIGMLEVIQVDFARLETDTETDESLAQKEHDKFMVDSKLDKTSKRKDAEFKAGEKQDNSAKLTKAKKDLKGTQKELDTAIEYYEKLKPTCIDGTGSYEENAARRKSEIESLQEALRILNGEDIL